VEPVEQSTTTTEQEICEQHFITHTTQQKDGRFVFRLPTKMDPKQHGSARLAAERRLHAIVRRLERDPELKFLYHNSMRKYKRLDNWYQVKTQEGKKHVSVYQFSRLQGNMSYHKSLDYYGIQKMIFSREEQHHTGANNKIHSKYKTKGASHYSFNI